MRCGICTRKLARSCPSDSRRKSESWKNGWLDYAAKMRCADPNQRMHSPRKVHLGSDASTREYLRNTVTPRSPPKPGRDAESNRVGWRQLSRPVTRSKSL